MSDQKPKSNVKGIVEDRGCTDILCCLLFVAAIVVFIIVASIGFANGQPDVLTSVWDSSGFPCGLKYKQSLIDKTVDNTEYSKLFFTTLNQEVLQYKSICVKSCPTEDIFSPSSPSSQLSCSPYTSGQNINVTTCATVKCDPTQILIKSYAIQTDILCVYKTTTLFDKICMIGDSQALASAADGTLKALQAKLNSYVNNEKIQKWVDGVYNAKYIILAAFFIAFVIGLVYMVVVRYFAGILVWITIVLFVALEIALAAYCLNRSEQYKLDGNEQNEQGMKYLSYIVFAIAAATVFLILCMYKKIQLGIAVIKCAALFVADVKLAILVPIITCFIVIFWVIIWIVVFLYSVSNFDTATKDPDYPIASVTYNDNQKAAMWFILFMGLWINAFIQAFEQFILVGSVCIWYYERKKGLHLPLARPFYWGLKKHMGSLAFGAFLLALVQLIRIILAYIEQQSKKTFGDNKLIQCLLKCLQCYAACFERFIKFLNRNAYIQIALKGTNFCESARAAMSLIWDNAGRASIIQGIGAMFIFIGQGFICLLTVFICYIILTSAEQFKSYSPWIALAIIFLLSLTVGILFMSIYGMGVDAIFVCFCQDESDNKGQQPEHTPELLQEFLDTNVKKEEVKK